MSLNVLTAVLGCASVVLTLLRLQDADLRFLFRCHVTDLLQSLVLLKQHWHHDEQGKKHFLKCQNVELRKVC